MKAWIVYDSLWGNTEKIAEAIDDALAGEAEVLRAVDVDPSAVDAIDLLIIGSPTHGGRPTEAVQGLLDQLAGTLPAGSHVAAFDTRLATRLVAIFGYAAARIARTLESAGATLLVPPEGFVVEGKEGPLRQGELERAAAWARQIASAR
ncbi:MAG: flavodoxin family protein [Anaerolineae bacterium]|jgi:flavodoxin